MGDAPPTFIVFLMLLCFVIFSVRKEHLIVPIIIAMCFLPGDISLKLGSLDFQAIRIMALAGLVRIYFSYGNTNLKLNSIDKLFIGYNVLGSITYVIASQNIFGAILNKSGGFIDSVILYIVFRYTIQSKESIKLIVKVFCICVILLLPFAIFEFYSATNLFSILGRSRISIRDEEIRAACTFSHSILFGSFAAALVPMLWADFMIEKKMFKMIALLGCIFFVYACSSSGPIIALAATVFFLVFFKWKNHSRMLAWGVLIAATLIHFVREKPIWQFLFVRISIKANSAGFHRYLLVDAAIKEFWHWWLLGYGDFGAQWHLKYWPWTHAPFTDMTNHYLLVGVRGGFFTMFLFIILCYKIIRIMGSFAIAHNDKNDQWLWWGFTVLMITHCISFLSVAYFGQITMLLYLTIAVSSFAYDESQRTNEIIEHISKIT
ncbi:O-antigen ligase family protein [Desulfosarcina ovata]|uniref:O-antigen ligase family protein n=1 Tax=Desulfosarcina ovata TaxID=83564 RepID=UPI0012D2F670|nr:O-antigen ligase family protein [Desulfosarcina ovata]